MTIYCQFLTSTLQQQQQKQDQCHDFVTSEVTAITLKLALSGMMRMMLHRLQQMICGRILIMITGVLKCNEKSNKITLNVKCLSFCYSHALKANNNTSPHIFLVFYCFHIFVFLELLVADMDERVECDGMSTSYSFYMSVLLFISISKETKNKIKNKSNSDVASTTLVMLRICAFFCVVFIFVNMSFFSFFEC